MLRKRKSLNRDVHDEAFDLRPLTYEGQIVRQAFWLGGVCNVGPLELDFILDNNDRTVIRNGTWQTSLATLSIISHGLTHHIKQSVRLC